MLNHYFGDEDIGEVVGCDDAYRNDEQPHDAEPEYVAKGQDNDPNQRYHKASYHKHLCPDQIADNRRPKEGKQLSEVKEGFDEVEVCLLLGTAIVSELVGEGVDLDLVRQILGSSLERKFAYKVEALLIGVSGYLKFITVVFVLVEEEGGDEDDAATEERDG